MDLVTAAIKGNNLRRDKIPQKEDDDENLKNTNNIDDKIFKSKMVSDSIEKPVKLIESRLGERKRDRDRERRGRRRSRSRSAERSNIRRNKSQPDLREKIRDKERRKSRSRSRSRSRSPRYDVNYLILDFRKGTNRCR